ncbi:MAG: peroxiredoxin [Bacteroidetes bacterium]|nr:peroxiredoxin [Bacteroidota bacterium]
MIVGEKAPAFKLIDQDGKPFRLLENIRDGIVLVFYPRDETAVCTKQLCEYSSNYDEFVKLGFQVVGISIDSVESHKNFSSKYAFHFRILSDSDKSVSRKYKALSITGMSKRKIVIIDRDGIVRFIDSKLPILYLKSASLLETLKSIK